MNYQDIFTRPDASLFKEGSLDPMGIQKIWSNVGQKIFQNKLNTISTDTRNFTINLFNHFLIRKIFNEYPQLVSKTIHHYKHISNEFDFKAGLVLVLEDIITGTLVWANSQKKEVSIAGILGSNKAELRLADSKEYTILMDKSKGGFLVRQLSLGVNGRYKGPFMNMNLLGRDLRCNESEWQEVDHLFDKWEEAKELIAQFIPVIQSLLSDNKESCPSISFDTIKENISLQDAIIKCFGERKLNDKVKSFWEEKLGLKTGAVKALYNQIEGNNNARQIYTKATKDLTENEEKEKLIEVIDLESFLSPCIQTFYLLTQKSVTQIDNIKEEAESLRTIINTNSLKISQYTPTGRLMTLIKYTQECTDGVSLLRKISEYHSQVSKSKGTSPWIHIKEDGTIERLNYVEPRYKTTDYNQEGLPWYNDYYISTLKAIRNDLNGAE